MMRLGIVAEKSAVWRVALVAERIASKSSWEAHVEHLVGFVEDDHFDVRQIEACRGECDPKRDLESA